MGVDSPIHSHYVPSERKPVSGETRESQVRVSCLSFQVGGLSRQSFPGPESFTSSLALSFNHYCIGLLPTLSIARKFVLLSVLPILIISVPGGTPP